MSDWTTLVVALLSAALTLAHVAIVVAALLVLPGNRRPQTAMAWLVLILALPFFGFAMFLLFGRTTVGRRRRTQQAEVNAAILAAAHLEDIEDHEQRLALPPLVQSFARLNRDLAALPLSFGNTVELVTDYAGCVEQMRREVAAATDHVHVQFYISAWDHVTGPFFEELVRAAERGVTVRFLFDHLGSRGIPVYRQMLARLEGTGIQWAPMLPIRPLRGQLRRPDLRNHRKILVVDGRVAFSGSQNLIEACYDKPKNQKLGRAWVELMARVEGPAVQELNVVFATDWVTETGESLAEVDAFCEAMIAIRAEIDKVGSGQWPVDDNPLRGAPHTAESLLVEEWDHPYTREEAAYPLGKAFRPKVWPPVRRIDGAYGDRNLVCSCPPIEAFT